MELESIKKEEKFMNLIMFGTNILVPIVAFIFVMLFLNGESKDTIVLLMVLASIVTKVCEKWLGKYAKYVYGCIIPVIGAITVAFASGGHYVAITHGYFMVTVMMIPYYNLNLILVNCIVTIGSNLLLMLILPKGFLALHPVAGWVFISAVYLLLGLICMLVSVRTKNMFYSIRKNEEKLERLLNSVELLSERLHDAGTSLSQVSENESASAEELAATSEQLVESSKLLSAKTDESMENLGELSEWEGVVADNVEQVEATSKDLLDKSTENKKLLNDLHTINGEVSESMKVTTDIAQKLSDAVQEIGATLNLISEISSSTNLLALNASIEAARAGEAGKGFAVVATEVGNLANNTQESLKEVEEIIERVQSNVKEITSQVEENSSKLGTQNEYFANVFKSMQNMIELLNISVKAIDTMGQAHDKQAEVIKKTISINQDIAEGIKNATIQFESINAMAESNASDTTEVTAQANAINDMVDEMTGLLKRDA